MSSQAIYMCRECGYLYDHSRGESETGIAWTDIDIFTKDWCCSDHGNSITYRVAKLNERERKPLASPC